MTNNSNDSAAVFFAFRINGGGFANQFIQSNGAVGAFSDLADKGELGQQDRDWPPTGHWLHHRCRGCDRCERKLSITFWFNRGHHYERGCGSSAERPRDTIRRSTANHECPAMRRGAGSAFSGIGLVLLVAGGAGCIRRKNG